MYSYLKNDKNYQKLVWKMNHFGEDNNLIGILRISTTLTQTQMRGETNEHNVCIQIMLYVFLFTLCLVYNEIIGCRIVLETCFMIHTQKDGIKHARNKKLQNVSG